MAIPLRQSTAADVIIGPFVDAADGVTPLTSLTIAQANIRLSKNGAAPAQVSASGSATHRENGYYTRGLSTTDTNTAGWLRVMVKMTGAAFVWADFEVLPQAVYDALFASGAIPANVTQFGGTNGTFAGGRPEVNTTHAAGTAWGSGAITSGAIAANAIGATQIASGAITAAKFASGAITSTVIAANAIGASQIASGAITAAKFAAGALDAVWDTPARTVTALSGVAADIRAALGLGSANLDTQLGGLGSDIATVGGAVGAVADDVNAIDAGVILIGADVDTLLDRTELTYGTAQGAGTGSDTLQLAAGQVTGDDQFNRKAISIVAGAGAGQHRAIHDTVESTGQIQIAGGAWDVAVDDTSVYIIH